MNSTVERLPNYAARRFLVAGVTALVLATILALILRSGSSGDTIAIPLPTSTTTTTEVTTTTTATTLPATSTTIDTTDGAKSGSTVPSVVESTTTVAPPTTILVDGVPVWPPYEPLPALVGVAALTGESADESITNRPILAVKIDNYRAGRPQWGLDEADAIIEENVEGVTRFVALFQSRLPDRVGPVRSARTGDLDIFAAMNRPVLGWSGGNPGVTRWIESAASSGLLVNFTAQRSPCYNRNSSRSAPHNLQLNPTCALLNAPLAGPARSLYSIDATWAPTAASAPTADSTFTVPMDGVRVEWTWDAELGRYLRRQDGSAHMSVAGVQISANNVVEISAFHAPSPVDARSPNPITVGGSTAVVHRDGVAIACTWLRPTPYDPFSFYDAATGAPVLLDAGTTFIELVRDE